MPTINGAIVVSGSGYTTDGNGGRKLVRLDNGWLVAVVKTNNYFYFYKTEKGDWSDKVQLCYINSSTITTANDISISSNGNYIYVVHADSTNIITSHVINAETITNVNLYPTRTPIDTGQTALGNVSLAINEAKTELHAAWASKNSTYPNSFNIRYAKGTINADGTVTWGATEQVTGVNTGSNNISNPSIICNNDNFVISAELHIDNGYGIYAYSKNNIGNIGTGYSVSPFYCKPVFAINSYIQSSPSAIYVPQSINGLANGRIWVAWNSKSSTSSADNIKMAYSDDSGVSWSNVIEVTTGNNNQTYPTISYNKKNEVFIVWQGLDTAVSSSYVNVRKVKYANSTLSAIETITNNTTSSAAYPNSIPSGVDFDSPLFIYTNIQTSSVNFYGSWSVETISPTVGERGQILNRQNMLTYNITSDSTIGTVTEKINGVVVGTKTLASGQNTTINITQSQWDAIPYGKYRNNSAGRNTIEIVTSNNTFTYTFEKWFDNTLDVISVTKAVKDSKDYYLPSAKKILSDAINSKGGSTTSTDSIESMASQVASGSGRKYKEGTSVVSLQKSFENITGASSSRYYFSLDTSTLGFIPSHISVTYENKTTNSLTNWFKDDYYVNGNAHGNCQMATTNLRAPINGNIIDIPMSATGSVKWHAYE